MLDKELRRKGKVDYLSLLDYYIGVPNLFACYWALALCWWLDTVVVKKSINIFINIVCQQTCKIKDQLEHPFTAPLLQPRPVYGINYFKKLL